MTARDDLSLPRARRPGGSHRAGRASSPRPAVARRGPARDTAPRGARRRVDDAPRPERARSGRGGRRIARRPHLPVWQELGLLVVIALVLAVVVKTFLVQAFYIPSGSMEPTFQVQDRVLVQKVSYWGGEPARGDVIVFDDPGGWLDPSQARRATGVLPRTLEAIGLYPTGGHLIKRVVGVGGDRVTCCGADGRLRVNGVPLREPYLADQVSTREQTFDVTVPDGYLWVMGDNRGDSADSRAHLGDPGGGFIPTGGVTGKAWLTVWPWSRAGTVGDSSGTFDDDRLDRATTGAGS